MTSIPRDVEDRFYNGEPSDLCKFCINDAVEILSGPLKGKQGAVISIVATVPVVIFHVELGEDGTDCQTEQANLKPV